MKIYNFLFLCMLWSQHFLRHGSRPLCGLYNPFVTRAVALLVRSRSRRKRIARPRDFETFPVKAANLIKSICGFTCAVAEFAPKYAQRLCVSFLRGWPLVLPLGEARKVVQSRRCRDVIGAHTCAEAHNGAPRVRLRRLKIPLLTQHGREICQCAGCVGVGFAEELGA